MFLGGSYYVSNLIVILDVQNLQEAPITTEACSFFWKPATVEELT